MEDMIGSRVWDCGFVWRSAAEQEMQQHQHKKEWCVMSALENGNVCVWRKNGKLVCEFAAHSNQVFACEGGCWAGSDAIITGAADETVCVWDAQTTTKLATMSGHRHWIVDAHLSKDGRLALSSSFDSTCRIWSAETNSQLAVLPHPAVVYMCSITQDNQRVCTTSTDHTASLWDTQTAQRLMKLAQHDDWVLGCAFSDSGACALTCSRDRTVCLSDSRARCDRGVFALRGHTDYVRCCAFTADKKFIVSCAEDRTLRVWCTRTLKNFSVLTPLKKSLRRCRVAPPEPIEAKGGEIAPLVVTCSHEKPGAVLLGSKMQSHQTTEADWLCPTQLTLG